MALSALNQQHGDAHCDFPPSGEADSYFTSMQKLLSHTHTQSVKPAVVRNLGPTRRGQRGATAGGVPSQMMSFFKIVS